MTNYVITKKFIEYICKNADTEKYIYNVLAQFGMDNPLKIVVDKERKVLNSYYACLESDSRLQSKDVLLTLLTHIDKEGKFENIESFEINGAEINDETFLNLCGCVRNQKKIIIDSHNTWKCPVSYKTDAKNCILHNGNEIWAFSKEEAIVELKNTTSSFQPNPTMAIPSSDPGIWSTIISKAFDVFSKKEMKIILILLLIGGLVCLHYNYCNPNKPKQNSNETVQTKHISISGTLKINGEVPSPGIIANIGITGENGVLEVAPDVDGGFKLKNVVVPNDEEISIELKINGKSYSKLVGVYDIDSIKGIAKIGELRIEIPKHAVKSKSGGGSKSDINITINQIKTTESSPEIKIQQ